MCFVSVAMLRVALPASLSGKQVLTAEELEARLTGSSRSDVTPPSDRDTQYHNNTTNTTTTSHTHHTSLSQHQERESFNQYSSNASLTSAHSNVAPVSSTTALQGSGGAARVRTLAEIEAAVKQQPSSMQQPPPPLGGAEQQSGDMRAFNRLLGMVKANQQPPPASSGTITSRSAARQVCLVQLFRRACHVRRCI